MSFKSVLSILSLLFGFQFTEGLRAQQSPCYDFICGSEPNFLCGSNNVTYLNGCTYSQAQCKDSTLFVLKPGPCDHDSFLSTTENIQAEELSTPSNGNGDTTVSSNCADPFCPTNYKPVCSNEGISYSNFCQFSKAQCRNPGISLKHEGRCENNENCLNKICPMREDPVCSGRTFRNMCEFSIAKCYNQGLAPATPGACAVGEDIALYCDQPCEDQYRPVCATDGQTYPNVCFFENARCKNPGLKIYKFEPC